MQDNNETTKKVAEGANDTKDKTAEKTKSPANKVDDAMQNKENVKPSENQGMADKFKKHMSTGLEKTKKASKSASETVMGWFGKGKQNGNEKKDI
ncbi:hypothetical protein GVAV_003501 [Gurleya vavrai]